MRRVVGTSMRPALSSGMIVIFATARPVTGDVVMIHHDGREKIKRIVEHHPSRVYVVGDNLAASTDSRHFGWLPADVVVAKLVWPRLL